MNLHEDIVVAQKLISGKTPFTKYVNFHEYSAIYSFTNEDLYNEFAGVLFKGKDVLTVTASGDQTLEAILRGAKKIDTFDISHFTKYYLSLKVAAIKILTKEEFIKFFINYPTIFDINIYEKIRIELDKNNQLFWDGLFDYFHSKTIYNSRIFSSVLQRNDTYLNKYDTLKKLIDRVEINSYDCNITEISNVFKANYDIIILSNILQYGGIFGLKNRNEDVLNFILKIAKLLNENGVMLAHYLFTVSSLFIKDFCGSCNLDFFTNRNDFEFQTFDTDTENRRGVLVYKK